MTILVSDVTVASLTIGRKEYIYIVAVEILPLYMTFSSRQPRKLLAEGRMPKRAKFGEHLELNPNLSMLATLRQVKGRFKVNFTKSKVVL